MGRQAVKAALDSPAFFGLKKLCQMCRAEDEWRSLLCAKDLPSSNGKLRNGPKRMRSTRAYGALPLTLNVRELPEHSSHK